MRPAFHFTAEQGWVNDPHGITFEGGRYHQFHQLVPDRLDWDPACRWGHATSEDLLTWTRHPIALAPGDGDDGVWTGCLVRPAGGPAQARILYTATTLPDPSLARIRTAAPVDGAWDVWLKGPVVVEAPAEPELIAFRDPFVVAEGHRWRMYVGAGGSDGHAYALMWVSDDLEQWRYDGVALSRSGDERDPVWTGAVWECPQIVDLDDRRLMITSVWEDDEPQYAAYAVGDAHPDRDGAMVPAAWGRLSFGGSYYAPSFFRDADDRACLLFWMRGVADRAAGWAGCHSVAYVLRVVGDRVELEPHPTLAAARGDTLPAGAGAPGGFDLEWEPRDEGDRLVLAGGEAVTAELLVADGRLVLAPRDPSGSQPMSMPWRGGRVRVVVDGPVLEICTPDGLLGGPVGPTDAWTAADGGCRAWRTQPAR